MRPRFVRSSPARSNVLWQNSQTAYTDAAERKLTGAPQEAIEPFLIVEAPRILFPFARRVIADAVRDGGFPPLMLEPIDFGGLYLQQLEARGGAGVQPVGNA